MRRAGTLHCAPGHWLLKMRLMLRETEERRETGVTLVANESLVEDLSAIGSDWSALLINESSDSLEGTAQCVHSLIAPNAGKAGSPLFLL